VEGGRRDLEAEGDQDHDERHHEHRVGPVPGDLLGDPRQLDRAGYPVDQAKAEKQERRGHGAKEEILQGLLVRLGPRPVEAGEHVEGQAGELEREERQEQLLRGRHQDEPGHREKDDRHVFRRLAGSGRARGHSQCQEREDQHPDARGDRERVKDQDPAEDGPARPEARAEAGRHHSGGGDAEGEPQALAVGAAPEDREIQSEREQRPQEQRRLGLQRAEELLVAWTHGATAFSAA